MKKLLSTVFIFLFMPSLGLAWSKLPVWSGWDNSTWWSTEMDINEPSRPTNDQFITSWDNDVRLSDEVRFMWMTNAIIEIGGVWRDGKLVEDYGIMISGRGYASQETIDLCTEIVTDIANEIYKKFEEPIIAVSYYPQFESFTIYLHPDKKHENERHIEIARHLESMRVVRYEKYWR